MPDDKDPLLGTRDPWYLGSPDPQPRRLTLGEQLAYTRMPDHFVKGDPITGWWIDDKPAESTPMTWWGQFHLRQQLNTLENPRGILGDNQAYIDEVQDLISAGRGEFNAWGNSGDALKNFIPFLPGREADLAPMLEEVDPEFDGIAEWREWEKQYPRVAEFLTNEKGLAPEEAFFRAPNRDAFMLTINLELTKARIQQEIDEYERHAGTFQTWHQFLAGGAVRQLALDPDAAKTLGLAVIGKAVGGGAALLRAAGVGKEAPKLARALDIASRAGSVGSASHNVLAKSFRLGTAGAMATEGAATGALWSLQHQIGMEDEAEWLGRGDYEYDLSDTAMSGLVGGIFGLGLFGAARAGGALLNRVANKERFSKEALKAAQIDDSPVAKHGLTREGLTLQRLEDDAFVKINRTLGTVVDDRLGFLLSKEVIEDAGRTMPEVGMLVDKLSNLRRRGVRISDQAMVEIIDDFLESGSLRHLTPEGRNAVERQMAREASDGIKAANPEWRARRARELTTWREARRRIDLLKGDEQGNIGPEDVNSVVAETGARIDFAPSRPIKYDEIKRDIYRIVADLEGKLDARMPVTLNRAPDTIAVAQQTARLASWRKALASLDAVSPGPDGNYSADVVEAIMALGGIRGVRAATNAGDLRKFIDKQIADLILATTPEAPPIGKSVAGKLVADINRQLAIIAEQKSLKGKGSGAAIKAAREEVRKLTASLNGLYGTAPKAVKAADIQVPSVRNFDRLKPAEQAKVLGQLADKMTNSPNEVMLSTSLIAKAMRAAGYTGGIARYVLDRTGINKTARARQKAIRESVMLFGNPDYNSRVNAGRGGAGVGIIAALGRGERDTGPVKQFLEQFKNRKGMTDANYLDFNGAVETAMNLGSRMPKGHQFEKEGNQLLDLWGAIVRGPVVQRAVRNKVLRLSKEEQQSLFLPSVVNEPMLRSNFKQAVADLRNVWHQQATDSDFLNPEYMESLGWIERPVDKYGNRSGKAVYKGPLAEHKGRKYPRKDSLKPEDLATYEAALDNPETLTRSAEVYWSRNLGDDVRGTTPREITARIYGANSRSPHRRKVTQRMLEEHPELKRYYNRDLFYLMDRYGKTTLFKAHAGESIQRAYGLSATLDQILNFQEAQLADAFTGDPAVLAEIKQAYDKAHEMVAWMGGYLPDVEPSYAVWSRYSADAISKAGFLLVAGGMGVSNGFEALAKMFFMVHSPADIGRNVKALIRGLADKSFVREELAGLAHDTRRLAVGYSHQLFAGRMDHAYELTTMGAIGRPWRDLWDTARGRISSEAAPNRFAGTALATLDAVGKTAYVAGAAPRITHATQVMVSGAVQREFIRYLDSIEKLRGLLRATPIDPSNADESFKQFRQLARKAGFGDRWDLAEKYIRWDLLDDGMVEALRAAIPLTKVKNKLHVTARDFAEVYADMPAGKAKDQLYEAMQRHAQYVDDRIAEELGETTAWSARTDARARSPWGRALDIFTSYMHNTYFHRLSKASSMPSRVFLGLVTGLVIAETLTAITQSYLAGTTVEELERQWDTPEEAMLSTLSNAMRIPMFGALSFIPKYIGDSAIDTFNTAAGNDPINPFKPRFGGVVGSSVDTIFRLGTGINQWAFGLTPDTNERGQRSTVNAGMKFIPVINSFYGKAAVRMFTDWKERQTYGRGAFVPTVGSGRSIWGDEDAVIPATPASNPEAPPGFNLGEALTRRNE